MEDIEMIAKETYSQCGEDVIVNFLFNNVLGIKDITYLDIGSNDPIELNNTYLHYRNGSRGVSVDANPYFKKKYEKERPDDKFVCAGVGTKDATSKFYLIDPHTLSTFSLEEAQKYTESGVHKILKTKNVKILSIDTILNKYFKHKKPNYLSIDVEGYDFDIIKSIDFKTWNPSVICVETLTYTTNSKPRKIVEISKYLNDLGYTLYADTYINSIFVNKLDMNGE